MTNKGGIAIKSKSKQIIFKQRRNKMVDRFAEWLKRRTIDSKSIKQKVLIIGKKVLIAFTCYL
jgi:hypothetical protein